MFAENARIGQVCDRLNEATIVEVALRQACVGDIVPLEQVERYESAAWRQMFYQ
jgi:hypothetical protein